MHDLALHLGMTTGAMGRAMAASEYMDWQRYAITKRMPLQRIEFYLAQIAWWVARSMGGADKSTLSDFLIPDGPEAEADDDTDDLEQAIEHFGFSPIKKG